MNVFSSANLPWDVFLPKHLAKVQSDGRVSHRQADRATAIASPARDAVDAGRPDVVILTIRISSDGIAGDHQGAHVTDIGAGEQRPAPSVHVPSPITAAGIRLAL